MTGTTLIVTVDGDPIGSTTSFTIDLQHTTADASSRDSAGWVESLSSRRSATFTFESLLDYADDTNAAKKGFHDLVAEGILNRSVFALVFGTVETGDTVLQGNAFLTGISTSAPDEETSTYSGTFASTGAITAVVNS